MGAISLLFPLLVFITIVVGLAAVHAANQRERGQLRADPFNSPFPALSVALAFDADHAIIWETQIPALQLISSAGRRGVGLLRLYAWHLAFARHYPELCDGSTFWQWLEFLESAKLATRHGYRVVLTAEGSTFMQYRITPQIAMAFASESSNSNERSR